MDESPADEPPVSVMSHSLEGLPALQFSATIALAGASQGVGGASVKSGSEERPTLLTVAVILGLGWCEASLLVEALGGVKTMAISVRQTMSAAKRARLLAKPVCKFAISRVVLKAMIARRAGCFVTVNLPQRLQ